jgi:hypothetical protein
LLPHIYLPYECDLIWQEYFGKITMDANGKRYFEGKEMSKG